MKRSQYITLPEIAKISGLSINTLYTYSSTGQGGFPRPVGYDGTRAVWVRVDIAVWLQNKRPRGRPAKVAS